MDEAIPNSKTRHVDDRENLNEVLLFWKSPSHPFKKRNRIFYQTVAATTFLLVVILFFLHEFMLIGVILSVVFVVYVLSSVPPIEVEHKVMPAGFENAGRLFRWGELFAFWFEKKWGFEMIVFQTRLPFPGQVRAVLSDLPKEKLKEIVGKYLIYLEKPPQSWTDRISTWLSNKIPLDYTEKNGYS